MKNNKGITLIALVITIIVLLILAGISIAMLTGENGLLNKASGAGAETKLSEAKEYVMLEANTLYTEYYEKKYNSNSAPTQPTAEAYVAANLSTKLTDQDSKKYVQSCTDAEHIVLVPKDANGKQVNGSYDTTSGTFSWTEVVATPGA